MSRVSADFAKRTALRITAAVILALGALVPLFTERRSPLPLWAAIAWTDLVVVLLQLIGVLVCLVCL